MASPSAIRGIHHFGLTVRDVDESARWYEKVLAFRRVGAFDDPAGTRRKVFLQHDALATRLGLTQHSGGDTGPFDETSVGLDHLSFAVDTLEDLQAWAGHLDDLAVPHSEIAPANSIPGAHVLVFRDPDNIQLELFFDPNA
jgi:glyoxylase I family protein